MEHGRLFVGRGFSFSHDIKVAKWKRLHRPLKKENFVILTPPAGGQAPFLREESFLVLCFVQE